MSGQRSRSRRVGIRQAAAFICLAATLGLLPSHTWAQSACDEPQDADYRERMDDGRTAVEAGEFEQALDHFVWAREHYDYAIIEYSIARALHHLERYADAQLEYNNFLRHYQGCPDAYGLNARAQQYLALAIQQQRSEMDGVPAETLDGTTTETPPGPADGGIDPGWFVLAGGGALIATGFAVDLAHLSTRDDKEAAAAAGDVDRFEELDARIDRVVVAEYVLFGVGLAAVATGIVLLVVDGDEAPEEPALSVGLEPAGGGALLRLQGIF